ncbi:MAG TPA: NrsF family protein [Vicinamibacterales bacterium]|jgi:hypothetical protein
MNTNERGSIEQLILADLRPVRRLARPWQRALAVSGLAALVAWVVYRQFGVRPDAKTLGDAVLWGLSALQVLYGVLLIVSALREAVPGRMLEHRMAAVLLLVGLGVVLTVTSVTWNTHVSHVPIGKEALYWGHCFSTPILIGLPSLLVTIVLAFRAYPTRPALTGTLAGLGAGLLSDASWRTYCEITDPFHVLSSHVAAIVVLTVSGMVAGLVISRASTKTGQEW